ncbi:MAG TPA: ribbon-helix-helix protein, CopG family [Candidatus Baltobacteraceae bacterium]|nr:ribbon-helix-helix protein, CopG family [Candidatus Baltobacteraceae bacterium]
MKILSISVDKDAIKQLDAAQKRLGIKSRSKLLRNAILNMLKEYDTLDSLSGNVESIFLLTYKESEKNHVSDMLHRFEDYIKTDLHQHRHGTCIDVLNVEASANTTRALFAALKKSKCIYSVTYSIIKETKSGKK